MSEAAISAHRLTRYFGPKRAVHDLDLSIPTGSIFGFLGRNGSGKTTTIRMLLGLLEPTRGSATVLGENCRKLSPRTRARIGYLTEGHYLPAWMRARECGAYQKSCHTKWDDAIFRSVLEHFSIEPDTRAKDLSRGERAGLCLALTLAPDPEVLILDDPALGLDPVVRRGLLESMLFVTRREGRTILFSSHLLGDVERVADVVAILDKGELRACCPTETLRSRVKQIVLRFANAAPAAPAIPGLLHAARNGNELSLAIANFDENSERAIKGLNAVSMETVPVSLEDVFVSYVGGGGQRHFFSAEKSKTNSGGAA